MEFQIPMIARLLKDWETMLEKEKGLNSRVLIFSEEEKLALLKEEITKNPFLLTKNKENEGKKESITEDDEDENLEEEMEEDELEEDSPKRMAEETESKRTQKRKRGNEVSLLHG
jgi:hypothetical protein